MSTPERPHTIELYVAQRLAAGLTTVQVAAELAAIDRRVINPRTATQTPGLPFP